MRTPTVGGNWKMNTDLASGRELAAAIAAGSGAAGPCEVIVFPPFPYLLPVGESIEGSSVRLGAQDVYDEPPGAFTGEVSTAMLANCGVEMVLTGHSERRHVLGESDDLVNRKTRAALAAGLEVTLCIGESLQQREAGETDAVNTRQLTAGLAGVAADDLLRVTIAYEPVWAIGTGRTATPDDAQDAHAKIRETLRNLYDERLAEATRIQYGGSVKPDNAASLAAGEDVDGFLVGGASLQAASFLAIIEAAASA